MSARPTLTKSARAPAAPQDVPLPPLSSSVLLSRSRSPKPNGSTASTSSPGRKTLSPFATCTIVPTSIPISPSTPPVCPASTARSVGPLKSAWGPDPHFHNESAQRISSLRDPRQLPLPGNPGDCRQSSLQELQHHLQWTRIRRFHHPARHLPEHPPGRQRGALSISGHRQLGPWPSHHSRWR